MSIKQEFFGDQAFKASLNLKYILALGNACAVRDTKDMCIDGNGGLAKGRIQHDICRFSADARKLFKAFSIARHNSVMFF